VGGGVVADHVHPKVDWHPAIELDQEALELDGAVVGGQLGDDLGRGDVQGGVQVGGAVADIVVGGPLRDARLQRQDRGGAVHVADLVDELGSVESLNASVRCGLRPTARQIRLIEVWLMPSVRASDRVDQWVASVGACSRVVTMTRSICSSVMWRGAPGRGSSAGLPAGGRQTATATWSPWAATPPADQPPHGCWPLSAGQHDPAALSQRLAGGPPTGPALQPRPLIIGQPQWWQLRVAAVAEPPPGQAPRPEPTNQQQSSASEHWIRWRQRRMFGRGCS